MLFFFNAWQNKTRCFNTSIIAVFLCFSNVACSSGLVDRDSFSWSGAGAYPKFVMSGEDTFLISDVSGVWKEGTNQPLWVSTNNGLENLSLSNIVFSNEEPAIGYVTTKQGIYKTINAGDDWLLMSDIGKSYKSTRGNNYNTLAIYPNDASTFIYFDDFGGLYEYKNNTVSSISLPINNEYISSILLVNNVQYLIVGTNKHRYKLEKVNNVWEVIEEVNLSTLDITSVSSDTNTNIITVGDKSVFISSDNTDTWSSSNLVQLIGSSSVLSRVAANYSSEGVLQITAAWNSGWQSGIVLSSDGGLTWRKASKTLDFSDTNPTRKWKKYSMDKILSVFMSNSQPNNIVITTYWGVWESTDFGSSWSENFIDGASNTVGSSIALTNSGEVITASMDVGIIKYNVNNNFKSISSLLPQSSNYNIYKEFAGHFWNVISDNSKIIATNSPWDSQQNQVVISEDGGASWVSSVTGLPSNYATDNTVWSKGYARALIQDTNNAQRFLLGIDGHGLFSSVDGGYSWVESNSQPPSMKIYNALAMSSVNNDIFWGTIGSGVYVSKDNGDSWLFSGLDNSSVFDMKATPEGNILAGVSGWGSSNAKLYIKRNTLETWEVLKEFPSTLSIDSITLDNKNPNIIVIGLNGWSSQHTGRIFISNDKGGSWSEIEGDFGIGVADMVISNEQKTLYATGYSQGVFSIDLSLYY